MHKLSLRRSAALTAVLALGAGAGACGSRENERGNGGGGAQTPGATVGTNPTEGTSSTTPTNTNGSSIIPAAKGKTTGAPVTKP